MPDFPTAVSPLATRAWELTHNISIDKNSLQTRTASIFYAASPLKPSLTPNALEVLPLVKPHIGKSRRKPFASPTRVDERLQTRKRTTMEWKARRFRVENVPATTGKPLTYDSMTNS